MSVGPSFWRYRVCISTNTRPASRARPPMMQRASDAMANWSSLIILRVGLVGFRFSAIQSDGDGSAKSEPSSL